MFQVSISGLCNEKLTIKIDADQDVFNNTTILQLKQKIIKEKNFPAEPENIRLIFAGKPLDNANKFKDHGIQNGSNILLVYRLPGGQ